jgi:hypothetical protein
MTFSTSCSMNDAASLFRSSSLPKCSSFQRPALRSLLPPYPTPFPIPFAINFSINFEMSFRTSVSLPVAHVQSHQWSHRALEAADREPRPVLSGKSQTPNPSRRPEVGTAQPGRVGTWMSLPRISALAFLAAVHSSTPVICHFPFPLRLLAFLAVDCQP